MTSDTTRSKCRSVCVYMVGGRVSLAARPSHSVLQRAGTVKYAAVCVADAFSWHDGSWWGRGLVMPHCPNGFQRPNPILAADTCRCAVP